VNSVALIGRLTANPTVHAGEKHESCTFRLAVPKSVGDGADFIDIVTFDKLASVCAEWLTKGREVAVVGKLRFSEWTGRDGERRSKLQVVADAVQFLGSPKTTKPAADESEEPAVGGAYRPSPGSRGLLVPSDPLRAPVAAARPVMRGVADSVDGGQDRAEDDVADRALGAVAVGVRRRSSGDIEEVAGQLLAFGGRDPVLEDGEDGAFLVLGVGDELVLEFGQGVGETEERRRHLLQLGQELLDVVLLGQAFLGQAAFLESGLERWVDDDLLGGFVGGQELDELTERAGQVLRQFGDNRHGFAEVGQERPGPLVLSGEDGDDVARDRRCL
jgi:single-strand DNA-binding protein